jgi:NADP-dependent 3-hydroxy acid dehydrogenase YdfG
MHIVVTGAGSGIGRSISITLAERGHTLILLGRNFENLESTKSLLKNPEQHQCHTCDIRNSKEIKKALENISSLYALIANAGVGGENQYGDQDRWQELAQEEKQSKRILILRGIFYQMKKKLLSI